MTAEPSAASVFGEWLASEIRRGVAAFQRDGDGWGVTAVVDRARPAAFSCDQDVVIRQAMADRGWSAPPVRGPAAGGLLRRGRGVAAALGRRGVGRSCGRAAEAVGVARQLGRRRAAAPCARRRPPRDGGPHRARGGPLGRRRAGRGRVGSGGAFRVGPRSSVRRAVSGGSVERGRRVVVARAACCVGDARPVAGGEPPRWDRGTVPHHPHRPTCNDRPGDRPAAEEEGTTQKQQLLARTVTAQIYSE